MFGDLGYGLSNVGLGLNADLRRYTRWEYGTSDTGWIVSTARRRIRPAGRTLGLRLRYWLNSFRGFAAFDVRGTDGRV